MVYKASFDTLSRVLTIGFGILLVLVLCAGFYIGAKEDCWKLIYPLLFIVGFVRAYINSISCYIVRSDKLIIRKQFTDVSLHRSDIKSVEFIGYPVLSRSKRFFQSLQVGGIFGYTGSFYRYDMGQMNWYATRRDTLVMITTASGNKVLLSPDEPQKFIAELYNHRLHQ